MKKSILIASVFLMGGVAFSQTKKDETPTMKAFSIGFGGGCSHSFMYPYTSNGINLRGNYGIFAIYAPVQHWGVYIGAGYAWEGSKTKNFEMRRTTDLEYFRIPIKAIYFFGNYSTIFRPKLTLGPSFGILAKEFDSFEAIANTFDAGITASVGFNYRLSPHGIWLNADLDYYQGLTDVLQHTGARETNANVGLEVGFAFGLE